MEEVRRGWRFHGRPEGLSAWPARPGLTYEATIALSLLRLDEEGVDAELGRSMRSSAWAREAGFQRGKRGVRSVGERCDGAWHTPARVGRRGARGKEKVQFSMKSSAVASEKKRRNPYGKKNHFGRRTILALGGPMRTA